MKVLSTFGDVDKDHNLQVRSVSCIMQSKAHTKIQAEDTHGGYYFTDVPPGESFSLELNLDLRNANYEDVVINWFCNATKTRGALFFNPEIQAYCGDIDGIRVRESLYLMPQLLDEQGRILSSGSKSVLWLEGRQSYFPTIGLPMKAPFSHSFVYLEYDTTSGLDAIFSKDTVQAVYNTESRFCDSESGSPDDGTPKFFGLYEVWRQFIEVTLNNDDIEDFEFADDEGDVRVITVVSKVMAEVFPGMGYQDIKRLRHRDYPKFCRHVQSYFFERCK